jgi:hypothetical protein
MGVLHPLILVGSQAETLSPLQSPLKLKTPESLDYQGVQGFRMRSRADSNRCSSFCRAEPSHSATGPFFRLAKIRKIYEIA